MSGDVVALRSGIEIASPGKPDEQLVAMLERVLELARAGEIAGAVIVQSYADGAAAFSKAGVISGYTAVGALEGAKRSLLD